MNSIFFFLLWKPLKKFKFSNSLKLMSPSIRQVFHIQPVHDDLRNNDWNSFFALCQQALRSHFERHSRVKGQIKKCDQVLWMDGWIWHIECLNKTPYTTKIDALNIFVWASWGHHITISDTEKYYIRKRYPSILQVNELRALNIIPHQTT